VVSAVSGMIELSKIKINLKKTIIFFEKGKIGKSDIVYLY